MIDQLAQDLFTKISAIPALANSTGLALVGQIPDPGGTKIPLPAAWVVLELGKSTIDPSNPLPPTIPTAAITYTVALYVPYLSQSDLITNQFPLLQKVINAVHGTTSPAGQRWRWQDIGRPDINPNRFIYPIRFYVDGVALTPLA